MSCFDSVFQKLAILVAKLIHKHFGRYKRLTDVLGCVYLELSSQMSWLMHSFRTFISTEMVRHQSNARKDLQRTLDLEKNPFFTQNEHYQDATRDRWLWHYRDVRVNSHRYLVRPLTPYEGEVHVPMVSWTPPRPSRAVYPSQERAVESETEEDRALRSLARLGYKNLKLEDLKRLHPPDMFQDELGVMADVRAYFQVAYKAGLACTPIP